MSVIIKVIINALGLKLIQITEVECNLVVCVISLDQILDVLKNHRLDGPVIDLPEAHAVGSMQVNHI